MAWPGRRSHRWGWGRGDAEQGGNSPWQPPGSVGPGSLCCGAGGGDRVLAELQRGGSRNASRCFKSTKPPCNWGGWRRGERGTSEAFEQEASGTLMLNRKSLRRNRRSARGRRNVAQPPGLGALGHSPGPQQCLRC